MQREFYCNLDYEKLKGMVAEDDEKKDPKLQSEMYKEALKSYEPIVHFLSNESIEKIVSCEAYDKSAFPDKI